MMITFKSFLIRSSNIIKEYGVSISGLCLVIITIFSLTPVSHPPPMNNIDKIEHLIAYAVCTMPISLAYHPRYKTIFWSVFMWGTLIEMVQPYVGRQAESMDAIVNAVGAGLGIASARYGFIVLCTSPSPSDE